jgi:hypothetical protein
MKSGSCVCAITFQLASTDNSKKGKGKGNESNEMGRACGAYGEGYRSAQGVGGEA